MAVYTNRTHNRIVAELHGALRDQNAKIKTLELEVKALRVYLEASAHSFTEMAEGRYQLTRTVDGEIVTIATDFEENRAKDMV